MFITSTFGISFRGWRNRRLVEPHISKSRCGAPVVWLGREVSGVGCHFVLRFPGFPPSLAPWTGAPCSRTSRTWVENDLFPMLFPTGLYRLTGKEKGGASPILFNPCTRKSANMGHPSRGKAGVEERDLSHNQPVEGNLP